MLYQIFLMLLGGVLSTVIFHGYSVLYTKFKHLKLQKSFSLHQRLVYLKEVLHDVEIMLENIDTELMNQDDNIKCINHNCPMANICTKHAGKELNENDTYKLYLFNNELEEFNCNEFRREI